MTVTYNQRGYVGSSMSCRAAEAYEDGEMPKSKWTKRAMLAAMERYCDEEDLAFEAPRMTKDELFLEFFEWKSWHHTSKFANATDFYGLDELAMDERFPALSAEEIARREEERRAAREAERTLAEERARERAEERERAEKEDAYLAAHGFAHDSAAACAAVFPDRMEAFTSKRGNLCYRDRETGNVYRQDARVWRFSAFWHQEEGAGASHMQ